MTSPEVTERKEMSGVELIAVERERQIGEEGWSSSHDSDYDRGQLAAAAACYAWPDVKDEWWPWEEKWWKPKDDLRNLVRAGALIAAEIDRLQRADG